MSVATNEIEINTYRNLQQGSYDLGNTFAGSEGMSELMGIGLNRLGV